MPAHGFYDRDLERFPFGRLSRGRRLGVFRGGCCDLSRVVGRGRFVERRLLHNRRRVPGIPPWINETLVVHRKEKQNGDEEESQRRAKETQGSGVHGYRVRGGRMKLEVLRMLSGGEQGIEAILALDCRVDRKAYWRAKGAKVMCHSTTALRNTRSWATPSSTAVP